MPRDSVFGDDSIPPYRTHGPGVALMTKRSIQLEYRREQHEWQASTVVCGSYFRTTSRDAPGAFAELCKLLRADTDSWRIQSVSPGTFVLEELSQCDSEREPGMRTTVEFPRVME
jgi:hypothetical protein